MLIMYDEYLCTCFHTYIVFVISYINFYVYILYTPTITKDAVHIRVLYFVQVPSTCTSTHTCTILYIYEYYTVVYIQVMMYCTCINGILQYVSLFLHVSSIWRFRIIPKNIQMLVLITAFRRCYLTLLNHLLLTSQPLSCKSILQHSCSSTGISTIHVLNIFSL